MLRKTLATSSITPNKKPTTLDPNAWSSIYLKRDNLCSADCAKTLDAIDPLSHLQNDWGDDAMPMVPLAGHSLGPMHKAVPKLVVDELNLRNRLLHGVHFPNGHPRGNESAHAFDCDLNIPARESLAKIWGVPMDDIVLGRGLSENLNQLILRFYKPSLDRGRTQIATFETDFASDQTLAETTTHYFSPWSFLTADSLNVKIPCDEKGIYHIETIRDTLIKNAKSLGVVILPGMMFSTGQAIDLDAIDDELGEFFLKNQIPVIIDLAHNTGNRPVSLAKYPWILGATGCAYKHISASAGASLGWYVRGDLDCDKYPAIGGWKSLDSSKVFPKIDTFDPEIRLTNPAQQMRISNPPPLSLIETSFLLNYYDNIGWNNLFNRSECLTRYFLACLKEKFGGKIDLITPENPKDRGATIVFQIKGVEDVGQIETKMKTALIPMEIDTRPPNNIRVTFHHSYNSYSDVVAFLSQLSEILAS